MNSKLQIFDSVISSGVLI